MPVYLFSAIDANGRVENGSILGSDLDSAAQQLAGRGLSVTSISAASGDLEPALSVQAEAPRPAVIPQPSQPEEAAPQSGVSTEPRSYFQTNVVGAIVGGVPLSGLFFFWKQLGAMLDAGINPVDAIDTLANQGKNQKMRQILQETRALALDGHPVSVGFQRYPEVFSPIMLSMLRVGERTGSIAEQCHMISDFAQRDLELRNMIRRETAYPKIVMASSVVIITVANAIISSITHGKDQGISAPTFIWIFIAIAVSFWLFLTRFGLKHQPIKQAWDGFLLQIPGIGGMVHGFAMAKFGRAFSAMFKAGVPYGEGVKLAADACGNEALRARMYPAAKQIEEGRGFTETFRETGAFSQIVLDMTNTGEATGNLDEMLLKSSEYYEDEGQTNARKAATLLGVLTLLAVGGYVLYIAMGFYGSLGSRYDGLSE